MGNNKKRVLIIGGNGYIGSLLQTVLKETYSVFVCDTNLFDFGQSYWGDYAEIPKSRIREFDVIILLAGNSSVANSLDMRSTFKNNVNNFVDLLDKISDKQLLIYASSASVYGDTKVKLVTEDEPLPPSANWYDLSKSTIDRYALLSGKNVIGLRFGTVCGYSPVLRTDVLINAMVYSAKETGVINVWNKDNYRSILYIKSLCGSIRSIIEHSNPKTGIYNLGNFNATIEEIAELTAKYFFEIGTPVKIKYNGNNDNPYNFIMNCEKFNFNFRMEYHYLNDILDSLLNNEPKHFVKRDTPIVYG